MDVDRYQSVWFAYDIRQTPTVVRYQGGREQVRFAGEQSETTWRRVLEDQRARMERAP